MKRTLAVSTLSLVFIFGSACADDMIPVTGNSAIPPSAQALLYTMDSMASTIEVLGQTVTAYAATSTPTPVPTKIPDANELKNLIGETIKDQLVATLGAQITVVDVKFGPLGAQEYSYLYVEMNCISDNNGACPATQVIIAVVDSCKQKKKKALENIPFTTQKLTITIYDPGHPTQVVDADWSDVLAYINDDIPANVFSKLLRYSRY